MKKTMMKIAVLSALVAATALTACDGAASLGRKIEGEWSGTPMRVDRKLADEMTMTPTFRFAKGGELTVVAQLAVMMPVNAPIDSLGTSAVSATAAGMATVRGTWRATDDDDIDLIFDLSTLDITMDPDVEFELANVWTASDTPSTRTVSEPVRRAFVKQMTEGMTNTLRKLDDLDDVRVDKSGTFMTAKFLKTKQTLSRVAQ
ncbi:MAG: hypothetical protein K2N10_01035 [Muribaculaceae bacterium]|nr:hypothetical protein [Muribaculaceae bacterium]